MNTDNILKWAAVAGLFMLVVLAYPFQVLALDDASEILLAVIIYTSIVGALYLVFLKFPAEDEKRLARLEQQYKSVPMDNISIDKFLEYCDQLRDSEQIIFLNYAQNRILSRINKLRINKLNNGPKHSS